MKLPKMNVVCSDDELSFIMNHVYVTKEDVVASGDFILVVHKTVELFGEEFVDSLPDDGIYVHKDNWKLMAKKCEFMAFDEEKFLLEVVYKKHREYIKVEKCDILGKYPSYNAFFPKEKKPVGYIGLDVSKISKLSQAMVTDLGGCELKFEFYGADKAVVFTHVNCDSNSKALVLPVFRY